MNVLMATQAPPFSYPDLSMRRGGYRVPQAMVYPSASPSPVPMEVPTLSQVVSTVQPATPVVRPKTQQKQQAQPNHEALYWVGGTVLGSAGILLTARYWDDIKAKFSGEGKVNSTATSTQATGGAPSSPSTGTYSPSGLSSAPRSRRPAQKKKRNWFKMPNWLKRNKTTSSSTSTSTRASYPSGTMWLPSMDREFHEPRERDTIKTIRVLPNGTEEVISEKKKGFSVAGILNKIDDVRYWYIDRDVKADNALNLKRIKSRNAKGEALIKSAGELAKRIRVV